MKLNLWRAYSFFSNLFVSMKYRLGNRWGAFFVTGFAIILISILGLVNILTADIKIQKPVQLYAALNCDCLPEITIRPSESKDHILVSISEPFPGCGYACNKLLIITFDKLFDIKFSPSDSVSSFEFYKFLFVEMRENAWSDIEGNVAIANIRGNNFTAIEFKIANGIYKQAFDEFSLHFDFREESFVGIVPDEVEQKLKEFTIPNEVNFVIESLPMYKLNSSIPEPSSIDYHQEFPDIVGDKWNGKYSIAYEFKIQRGKNDLFAVFSSDSRRREKEGLLIFFSTLLGFGIGLIVEVIVEYFLGRKNDVTQ